MCHGFTFFSHLRSSRTSLHPSHFVRVDLTDRVSMRASQQYALIVTLVSALLINLESVNGHNKCGIMPYTDCGTMVDTDPIFWQDIHVHVVQRHMPRDQGRKYNEEEVHQFLDDLLDKGEFPNGRQRAMDSINEALSILADITPGVSSGKSAIELISGENPMTGRKINRIISAINIVVGLIPGGKVISKGKLHHITVHITFK